MRCLLTGMGLWIAVAFAGEAVPAEAAPPGACTSLVLGGQLLAQLPDARRPDQPVGQSRRNNDSDAGGKQPAAASTPQSQPQVRTRPGVTLWYYPYSGYYPFPYGPVPNGYAWYGSGYYYPTPGWPWALPPLYASPGSLYGPDSVRRFMGSDRPSGPAAGGDANRGKEGPANLRGTNAESVAMGRRFLHLGDEHFRAGRYAMAYDRYRNAVEAAPRLADAYFRQGFALTALGRYDAAAREFKRGLEIDPDWPRSDFRLTDLYGEKSKAKTAHLDAMAKAAEAKSGNADLLFLIGVYLHFDGQTERARPFFQRAAELARGNPAHLNAFQGPPEPDEADEQ